MRIRNLALSLFGVASAGTVLAVDATSGIATLDTAQNVDVITGTNGVLTIVGNFIASVASNAWPIIAAIVAIGIVFWLGRAMIRAVRSYFSASM